MHLSCQATSAAGLCKTRSPKRQKKTVTCSSHILCTWPVTLQLTYHIQQHDDAEVDAHGSPCGCNLRVISDQRPLEGSESADSHHPINDDPEHSGDHHADLAGRKRRPNEHRCGMLQAEGSHHLENLLKTEENKATMALTQQTTTKCTLFIFSLVYLSFLCYSKNSTWKLRGNIY